MFVLPDESYLDGHWRPLRLTKRKQKGWDVFAYQTGLIALDYRLSEFGSDGIFGDETAEQTWRFQQDRDYLVDDGIAGGATQRALGTDIALYYERQYGIVHGLLYGQLEKESSLLPGNYSALRADGHRDCGIAQCNNAEFLTRIGFDVMKAMGELGGRLLSKHDLYLSRGLDDRRAWELASGSWNAPAWADRAAGIGEPLPEEYEASLDAYIAATTVYVRWQPDRKESP